MTNKRFIGAGSAIFIANQITDPLIHSMILGKTYEALNHIWRPDMMSKMWIMVLASFAFAFLFLYFFTRGYKGTGLLEGVRFGIIIGILMNGIVVLQQYVVYSIPFSLAVKWCILGMLQYVIYGLLAAAIYKPKSRL